VILLLLSCSEQGPDGAIRWAVNYATVSVDQGTLSGHHVWAFYADGWERDYDEAFHRCSLVQSVIGEETEPWAGCQGCIAMYEVQLQDLEHDCTDRVVSDPAYEGVLAFGIGDIDRDIAGEEPYEQSLGWYLAYEADQALDHGYAWAEGLEFDRPIQEGWVDGQVYTLWPAYAWDLGTE